MNWDRHYGTQASTRSDASGSDLQLYTKVCRTIYEFQCNTHIYHYTVTCGKKDGRC